MCAFTSSLSCDPCFVELCFLSSARFAATRSNQKRRRRRFKVDQLRQEVSAVILNSQQGDRVVLELDSGGGTVTGYETRQGRGFFLALHFISCFVKLCIVHCCPFLSLHRVFPLVVLLSFKFLPFLLLLFVLSCRRLCPFLTISSHLNPFILIHLVTPQLRLRGSAVAALESGRLALDGVRHGGGGVGGLHDGVGGGRDRGGPFGVSGEHWGKRERARRCDVCSNSRERCSYTMYEF